MIEKILLGLANARKLAIQDQWDHAMRIARDPTRGQESRLVANDDARQMVIQHAINQAEIVYLEAVIDDIK